MTVSLALLAAHLIGDFPLQPDWIARTKTENNTRLLIHVTIHALLVIPVAWYAFPDEITRQLVVVLWITISHLAIDFRRWTEPKEGWSNDGMMWVWVNDQVLHITSLALTIPIAELGLWG
jgi:hypothetical protein